MISGWKGGIFHRRLGSVLFGSGRGAGFWLSALAVLLVWRCRSWGLWLLKH
ncbi:hypothetical protein [Lysobacter capsici]|uniref:hypothetical protein n=1 Tax=Lysobacter capsici TaxID=435897 RepID=UPI001BFFFA87|nr:hypothetical protein [Lysobacter capsici]QWF16609.1 hypothetical protein KME82_23145 [Lysobacter capsici]